MRMFAFLFFKEYTTLKKMWTEAVNVFVTNIQTGKQIRSKRFC